MTEKGSTTEERRLRGSWGIAPIVVVGIVLLVSLVVIKPAAPKKLVLLTGPEGSGYHLLGKRLASSLGEDGLETEVRVTGGALDNLGQLLSGVPDAVAIAPSKAELLLDDSADPGRLVSLGSIGWEPVWLLFRSDLEVRGIPDLAGLKVATGPRGTVVDHIARELLEANGITGAVALTPSEGQAITVARALADGTIDAAFAMGDPASPEIGAALLDEAIDVASFDRAEAYQARDPGIARIVAPEGVFDLARNIPPEDVALLSVTTNLVTVDTFYPGAVPLLLRAVSEVRSQHVFVSPGASFPNSAHTSLPLKRAAAHYYEAGETGLSRHLPYKVTRWLNHLGFFVIPLLVAAFLFVKTVPLALRVWSNLRLVGLLKRLEAVEKAHAAGGERSKLLSDLDLIDRRSARMFVPRSTVHDYVDFRQFLHDMRERIDKG